MPDAAGFYAPSLARQRLARASMHVRCCVPITIPTASKQLRTNSLDGQFSARLLPYTVTIIYTKKQTVIMSGQLNFTVCSILISQTPNRHNPNSRLPAISHACICANHNQCRWFFIYITWMFFFFQCFLIIF